jgi:putative ABC transport system substrate-binding protein
VAPDVIVGSSTPVIAAMKQATSSIPIVFASVNDPVGQGFISSLARPGANITGFTLIDFPIIGKWLDMLKDVIPDVSRIALMFNPDTAPYYDVSFVRSNTSQSRT